MRDSQLLKVIKDKKLLPAGKLKQALDYKKKLGTGVALSDVMVNLGLVSRKQMNELVAQSKSVPVADISSRAVSVEAMEKLPPDFIKKYAIVPLAEEKGKILLAMAEPVDLETLEEIRFMTNCLVETTLASREQIQKAVREYYSLSPHERRERARQAAKPAAPQPKPIPESPHLARVLAEILMERGLVTREEITVRLKAREL